MHVHLPHRRCCAGAEAQSFDGPAPETINGRLAMLGITSALAAEFVTGVGLREQWLDAPAPILFSFAIIAIASYIPILKGFTRCVWLSLLCGLYGVLL